MNIIDSLDRWLAADRCWDTRCPLSWSIDAIVSIIVDIVWMRRSNVPRETDGARQIDVPSRGYSTFTITAWVVLTGFRLLAEPGSMMTPWNVSVVPTGNRDVDLSPG